MHGRMTAVRSRIRAARRWPPKRCRILADGDLNAIPVGRTLDVPRERPSLLDDERIAGPGIASFEPDRGPAVAESCEVVPVSVEYLVRAARVTDIDRVVALGDDPLQTDRGERPLGVADLMRQLVYLPQASIVVAEAKRVVVGGAILALRPSVRAGGYVGTIDLLVIDAEYDVDRITEALLEELVRSASNKGCTIVEAERPDDADALARWQRMGFSETGPRIHRTVTAAGSAARHAK